MDDVDIDNLLAPIKGPAAWRGVDLAASDAWRRQLTDNEIAALTRAAKAAQAMPCPGFGADAFVVPELLSFF